MGSGSRRACAAALSPSPPPLRSVPTRPDQRAMRGRPAVGGAGRRVLPRRPGQHQHNQHKKKRPPLPPRPVGGRRGGGGALLPAPRPRSCVRRPRRRRRRGGGTAAAPPPSSPCVCLAFTGRAEGASTSWHSIGPTQAGGVAVDSAAGRRTETTHEEVVPPPAGACAVDGLASWRAPDDRRGSDPAAQGELPAAAITLDTSARARGIGSSLWQ